jgi:hypothetical protein
MRFRTNSNIVNENQQLHLKAARVALDAAMSHLAKAALELRQTGSGCNHGIMADWQGMIGKLATDSVEIAETASEAAA